MLKKPGLEELVRELERDYARWEQVYMAGSKDPFWPDGVNANLCRTHILCGKKRIRKEKLYIAYGSNLDRGQMARRCPTAEVVCSGMLYGHELLFRGSQFGAVATVEPKPGACVPVLVWKIKPSDERALDLYEGYPHLYRKENLSVTMDGGERDIMAYVMTGEREYGVPARSYYETIARGYADAGFDIGVLNEAVQESVRRMLDEMAPEEELNETWQMTL